MLGTEKKEVKQRAQVQTPDYSPDLRSPRVRDAGRPTRFCYEFFAPAVFGDPDPYSFGLTHWRIVPFYGGADLYGFRHYDDRAAKNLLPGSMFGEVTPDAGWVESQIGVLKSLNVAAYVVKQLRLADDPAFIESRPGSSTSFLRDLAGRPPQPKSDAERAAKATSALLSGLQVKRIGPSYMIQIDFRSSDPEVAVKVANAMIDGYVFDQLNAKYQANRRAGDWLQERLQALRDQSAAAERAVIDFKAKNNIVAANGTLMNEKQLGDMSGQLAAARSHAGDLQARLNRIETVRQSYRQDQPTSATDETVSEAMSNAIITRLTNPISRPDESSGGLVGTIRKRPHCCGQLAQSDPRYPEVHL